MIKSAKKRIFYKYLFSFLLFFLLPARDKLSKSKYPTTFFINQLQSAFQTSNSSNTKVLSRNNQEDVEKQKTI